MAGKKEPGRFTIGFNAADPAHQAVVELLNRQGRRKAQFIVNAVQHYIHCPETSDIPQFAPVDSQMIRNIVMEILSQGDGREYEVRSFNQQTEYPAASAEKEMATETGGVLDGMEDLIGAEAMATIADTLAAFREQ